MKLLKRVGTDADPGQWFPFCTEEKKDAAGAVVKDTAGLPVMETVEFRIRRVPDGKARELNYLIFGRKISYKTDKEEKDKFLRFNVARASYALVDSKNAEFEVGDEAVAETYGQLFGKEVKTGDVLSHDGRWTDEVKRYVLSDYVRLMDWILEKADSLEKAGQEDEEAARGN
jgi:hypothetical protein